MMKRTLGYIDILYLLIPVLLVQSCYFYSDDEILKQMIDVTEMQISDNYQDLKIFDDMDWGSIAKLRLDSLGIKSLLEDYDFVKFAGDNGSLYQLVDIEGIYQNEFPNYENLFYYEDCRRGLFWCVLVNNKTNQVWFEIDYTDFNEDESDCK